MSETGLEVAVAKIETRLDAHLNACERRYQEGNERLQRMFEYIKNAHENTGKQISETTKQIKDLEITIAESRGAGKMAKLMAGAAATLAGGISGLVSGGLFHK